MLLFLVLLSVGVGVGIVSGETNPEDQYSLEHSEELENILPGENTHSIGKIEIHNSNKDTQSSEEISLYVGLSEIKENNIDVSSADIKSINITNGDLNDITRSSTENESYIRIQIDHTNPSESLLIHNITLGDIETESAESISQPYYEFGVVKSHSAYDFDELKSDDHTTSSSNFKIIDGDFGFPNQATVSSRLQDDDRTTAAVSMRSVVSNVNSTIVITRGEKEPEVIGIKSELDNISNSRDISVDVPSIGGEARAHLIADPYLVPDELEIGDEIPNSTLENATASDNGNVMLGTIDFEDVKENSSINTNVTIPSTILLDREDNDTPFVISLHPITPSGNIVFNRSIGHSEVLTGRNEDVIINIESGSGQENTIWQSNRFAASMRLAEDHNEGDIIDLNSTSFLPNSDLDRQFVDNGVADGGNILISESITEDNSSGLDYLVDNNTSINDRIYAGSTVGLNLNDSTADAFELHQIRSTEQSMVAAVGNPILNNSYSGFNTTSLSSGEYSLSDGSENISEFHVVGSEDQYIDTLNHSQKPASGDLSEFGIAQDVRNTSFALLNTTNQSTAATVELATPGNETVPITLNTYAAGETTHADDLVTVGEGATVESVETSTSNGTLSPGTYELAFRSAHGSVTTTDNATVTVQPRSTNDVELYTTEALDADAFDTSADIRTAIDTETLSPSATVTDSETVVYAINASGLSGLPAARNATLATGSDLDRFDGFDFGLRRSSTVEEDYNTSSDGTTLTVASDTDELGPTPEEATVHLDETGLYLVAAGDDALSTSDDPDDGEEFTAAFRVADDSLRSAADSEDEHTVATELSYVDSDTDSDPTDDETDTGTGDSGSSGGSGAGGGGSGGSTGDGGVGGSAEAVGSSDDAGGTSASGEAASPGVGASADAGRPIDSATTGGGSHVRAVADLRTPYRDRPDATADDASTAHRDGAAADADTSTGAEPPTDTAQRADGGAADDGRETDESHAEPDAPAYENAPIRSTAYDVPGFGLVAAVLAIVSFARLAGRRR